MFEPGQMISLKEGQVISLYGPYPSDNIPGVYKEEIYIDWRRMVMFIEETKLDSYLYKIVLYRDKVWLAQNDYYYLQRSGQPFNANTALRITEAPEWVVRKNAI